jgi:hypothetical protein
MGVLFARLSSRTPSRTPPWIYAAAGSVPVLVLALVATQSADLQSQMFRDPYSAITSATAEDFPPLLGAVSNFGILLWCTACAVTAFAGMVMRQRNDNAVASFLLVQSAISGILMADDLFLLHEHVYPWLFGIGESTAFLIYMIGVCTWAVTFRAVIFAIGPGLLVVSGTAFAIGIGGDLLDHFPHDLGIVQRWLEDAAKLVGIAFWAAFALRGAWVFLEVERH